MLFFKSVLQQSATVQRLKLIYKRCVCRVSYFKVTKGNLTTPSSYYKRISIHFDNVQPRFARRSFSFRSSARFVQATPGSYSSKFMHLERPRLEGVQGCKRREREREYIERERVRERERREKRDAGDAERWRRHRRRRLEREPLTFEF